MLNSEANGKDWRPTVPAPFDAGPPNFHHPRYGKPVLTWTYKDATGNTWCHINRFTDKEGKKQFCPLTYGEYNGKKSWRWKGSPDGRPLYNLLSIANQPNKPIIVVEGEKAAEAAGKLFPDMIATTTMGGALAPHKTDFGPLMGRDILIWPDNDGAGHTYAQAIVRLCKKLVQKISVVEIPQSFAEAWDLADPIPDGLQLSDLQQLLKQAKIVFDMGSESKEPHSKSSITLPRPFRLTKNGVEYETIDSEGNSEWNFLCSPLHITAFTRNKDGEDWGRLLKIIDKDGKSHLWAMPMRMLAGDGTVYRERLLELGLLLDYGSNARRYLHQYITIAQPNESVLCVNRIGWHQGKEGPVFVLPDQTFGGEQILLQGEGFSENLFQVKGSLKEWQEHIGRFAIGNSRIEFAVSCAFAGPLLEISSSEGGGFHLHGYSSKGKTTTAYVSGSVCGGGTDKAYLKSWRTTANGLEGTAFAHHDNLLCLDEINQISPQELGEAAYLLANGFGKNRADRNGLSRKSKQWQLIFLSSGEKGIFERIADDGKSKATAGQQVRIADIPAEADRGLGLFENLHGFPDAEKFATYLQKVAKTYYGTPLRAFLEKITSEERADLAQLIKNNARTYVDSFCPKNCDGQVLRVANRFALVAVAGELAISYEILPWPKGTAIHGAAICFQAWLGQRGGKGTSEKQAMLRQIKHFFELHGESRFSPLHPKENGELTNGEKPTINRAGYKKEGPDGIEYFVLPEVFRSELCKGFDSKLVAKLLAERGLIHTYENADRYTTKHRFPDNRNNPTDAYQFKSNILSEEAFQ
ncbi:MAG: DUF927 domain-containing protein [Bdellovibrionota bacterium]